MELLKCRVCGLIQLDLPWGEDGNLPSYNICPCCGVEFGYEDALLSAMRKWRENWLKNGAVWSRAKEKPNDWNLEEQLKGIPEKYL